MNKNDLRTLAGLDVVAPKSTSIKESSDLNLLRMLAGLPTKVSEDDDYEDEDGELEEAPTPENTPADNDDTETNDDGEEGEEDDDEQEGEEDDGEEDDDSEEDDLDSVIEALAQRIIDGIDDIEEAKEFLLSVYEAGRADAQEEDDE